MTKRSPAQSRSLPERVSSRLLGGHENWPVFHLLEKHFIALGVPVTEPPPVPGISKTQWNSWTEGTKIPLEAIDAIAAYIATQYSQAHAQGNVGLQFEGLASLVNNLYRLSTPEGRTSNKRLFEYADIHFKALGWLDQRTIALRWGCHESLVSGFLSGARAVQIDHINRLAFAIASAYDNATDTDDIGELQERYGSHALHHLLDELLAAAGYSVFAGGREVNRVWRKLTRRASASERILRVGYYWWPPMMTMSPDDPRTGLARDLMDNVAGLMATTIEWVPIRWPDVYTSLATGDIDLIPPIFLRLPVRMLDVALSKPVPYLQFIPNGIVNTNFIHTVMKSGRAPAADINSIHTDKLVWITGKSEVTKLIARLIDPNALIDDSKNLYSIEDGWRDVLKHPLDEHGRLRVFPTEQVTIAYVRDTFPNLGASELLTMRPSTELGLGVAFAANSAEPRLIQVIDACLDEMHRRPSYMKRVFARYSKILRDADALPDLP